MLIHNNNLARPSDVNFAGDVKNSGREPVDGSIAVHDHVARVTSVELFRHTSKNVNFSQKFKFG